MYNYLRLLILFIRKKLDKVYLFSLVGGGNWGKFFPTDYNDELKLWNKRHFVFAYFYFMILQSKNNYIFNKIQILTVYII